MIRAANKKAIINIIITSKLIRLLLVVLATIMWMNPVDTEAQEPPQPAFLADFKGHVYGNYGGEGWSGGKEVGEPGPEKPPINKMDYFFQKHDYEYENIYENYAKKAEAVQENYAKEAEAVQENYAKKIDAAPGIARPLLRKSRDLIISGLEQKRDWNIRKLKMDRLLEKSYADRELVNNLQTVTRDDLEEKAFVDIEYDLVFRDQAKAAFEVKSGKLWVLVTEYAKEQISRVVGESSKIMMEEDVEFIAQTTPSGIGDQVFPGTPQPVSPEELQLAEQEFKINQSLMGTHTAGNIRKVINRLAP
ncbi:hypothetical protein MYX64_09615 [Nitrospinae bacterium AH_259_B05_G02_I21]|nr:hypothetical protein [Nitrospinae bacterium AH_259_B05_G02_I21]